MVEHIHLTMGSFLHFMVVEYYQQANRVILPADQLDFLDASIATYQKAINSTIYYHQATALAHTVRRELEPYL